MGEIKQAVSPLSICNGGESPLRLGLEKSEKRYER